MEGRPHDYPVKAGMEHGGSVVVFRAKIGKLIVPHEQWDTGPREYTDPKQRHAIRKVEDCDYYACQLDVTGAAHNGVFILRPSRSKPEHFVLAGHWKASGYMKGRDPSIWQKCDEAKLETVRLC